MGGKHTMQSPMYSLDVESAVKWMMMITRDDDHLLIMLSYKVSSAISEQNLQPWVDVRTD